jgi:thiosulfate dehydrogenase (quinone) large subunit
MTTSASANAQESSAGFGSVLSDQAPASPVTLSERSLVTLALVRLFFGFLWFQQLSWKMPPDFSGLRTDVRREVQHTILPGYSTIIQNVFLTHFSILGTCVWAAEFLVAMLLLFGLFTRLGALLALVLSIQLYVGIAYAPGEWYWGYGMLLMISLTLLAVPTGRRLGLDQMLLPWLNQKARNSRLARLLRALV